MKETSAKKKVHPIVPNEAQRKRIRLGTMRLRVWPLASLRGLRIQRCRELWCRWQTWLGARLAVALAQAGSYNSNSTHSLGNSICCGCRPEKTTDKKKKYILYDSLIQNFRNYKQSIVRRNRWDEKGAGENFRERGHVHYRLWGWCIISSTL